MIADGLVLDLSKVESGKVELRLEPFDVAELMEDVRLQALPLARESGNELVVESRPGTVFADRTGCVRWC